MSRNPAQNDPLFDAIAELTLAHGPVGDESEIDAVIVRRLAEAGLSCRQDARGNIIAEIPGRDRTKCLVLSAHKDEIGAMVERIEANGVLRPFRVGGSYPWIYGEGVVDVLGDDEVVSGILSFGARHVGAAQPQRAQMDGAAVTWDDAWIETFLTPAQLAAAGVRAGSRIVIGKHRKRAFLIGDRIAAYALDDRAGVAILLALAAVLRDVHFDVRLAFTTMEEIGGVGAAYLSHAAPADAWIAFEIAPLSPENAIQSPHDPVLVGADGHCFYDVSLTRRIAEAGEHAGIAVQHAVLRRFGSDASHAAKAGHVARTACIGFPTHNTHGFEITSLRALEQCTRLARLCCELPDIVAGRE